MGRLNRPFLSLCCDISKGFTYAEVMVSMLVAALFFGTTLQAYVAATSIRVKTQQVNAAIASIENDIEAIRQLAQRPPTTVADCQPSSGSYAQQLMEQVITQNTATIGLGSQPLPEQEITQTGQTILKQSGSLALPETLQNYQLRRTLLVNQNDPPAAQVLQVHYEILRSQTEIQSQSNDPSRSQDNRPSDILLAHQHADILPQAALVCF